MSADTTKQKTEKAGPRPGSKTGKVAELIRRDKGCTGAEALKATGWLRISMPAITRAAGIKLRKVKEEGKTRYFAA